MQHAVRARGVKVADIASDEGFCSCQLLCDLVRCFGLEIQALIEQVPELELRNWQRLHARQSVLMGEEWIQVAYEECEKDIWI